MLCNGIKDLNGCGNCSYILCSKTLISSLTSTSITKLCLYIASGEQTTIAPIDIANSTMRCDGELTVAWSKSKRTSTKKAVQGNARICSHILSLWCAYHPASSRSMVGLPIRQSAEKVCTIKKEQELIRFVSTLSSSVSDINKSDGSCCSVVYGKVTQCCSFKLVDKLSLSYIHDFTLVLDSLYYNIKCYQKLGMKDFCIDLCDSGVGCDASLILSKKFMSSSNPLGSLITQCTVIINEWYSMRSYSDLRVSLNEVLYGLKTVKNISNLCNVLSTHSFCMNKS